MFRNLFSCKQTNKQTTNLLQTHFDERRPDPESDHDPAHPLQLQLQWTAGASTAGHFQHPARPHSPNGHILPNTHIPWRGTPNDRKNKLLRVYFSPNKLRATEIPF